MSELADPLLPYSSCLASSLIHTRLSSCCTPMAGALTPRAALTLCHWVSTIRGSHAIQMATAPSHCGHTLNRRATSTSSSAKSLSSSTVAGTAQWHLTHAGSWTRLRRESYPARRVPIILLRPERIQQQRRWRPGKTLRSCPYDSAAVRDVCLLNVY